MSTAETSLSEQSKKDFNNNGDKHQASIDKVTSGEKAKNSEDTYWSRFKKAIRTKPHLFIIFFISIIGFCYHFNIALAQYWDYKTTVSYTNEDPKDYKYQYPSATLCFQDVIPYYKLKDKFPEYASSVERIEEEMKRRNDSNFWTKPDTIEFVNVTGVKKLKGKLLFCVEQIVFI